VCIVLQLITIIGDCYTDIRLYKNKGVRGVLFRYAFEEKELVNKDNYIGERMCVHIFTCGIMRLPTPPFEVWLTMVCCELRCRGPYEHAFIDCYEVNRGFPTIR
jgi:hypothetical protein